MSNVQVAMAAMPPSRAAAPDAEMTSAESPSSVEASPLIQEQVTVPLPHRDTQFHDTWSALTEVQQTARIHTTVHTHGIARMWRDNTGSAAAEEARIM